MEELSNDEKKLVSLIRGRVDKDLAIGLCLGLCTYGLVGEAIEYIEDNPDFTEQDFCDFVFSVLPDEACIADEN